FTPWQQELAGKRKDAVRDALESIRCQVSAEKRGANMEHQGRPNHRPPSAATDSDWRITVPEWCADQRNQMTGPVDDAELTVKMLNSGAPGVMIDLEDSMANFYE